MLKFQRSPILVFSPFLCYVWADVPKCPNWGEMICPKVSIYIYSYINICIYLSIMDKISNCP